MSASLDPRTSGVGVFLAVGEVQSIIIIEIFNNLTIFDNVYRAYIFRSPSILVDSIKRVFLILICVLISILLIVRHQFVSARSGAHQ